jgi:hypothetical protein
MLKINTYGGVMNSVLGSSCSSPHWIKPKTIKLIFAAFLFKAGSIQE